MASYKIYFLNFCHKNWSPSEVKSLAELQNAIGKAVFMKKVIFAPVGAGKSHRFAVEQS